PGVPEAIDELRAAGYRIVIITNQSGIGRGWITQTEYEAVHARLMELLGAKRIDGTYYCPDAPGVESLCRKPAPGMVLQAARELGLDLGRSWFIGDKEADVQCGRNAGVRSILVQTGYGKDANAEGAEYVATDLTAAAQHILAAR
ncbi:MAG: D-glycero-alpha-D-manno-heptose-1,7-bisphosphate 7-phosphatase, partial [Chthoniobacteraceae bacterium]